MTPDPASLRSVREDTIDSLCRHFAADDLSLGELERRLEKARSAASRDELKSLLKDLEPRPRPAVEAGPRERNQPVRSSPAPASRSPSIPEAATSARPSAGGSTPAPRFASRFAFAIMGGTRRAGRWAPPDAISAVAIMGGVELDFRQAVLHYDVIEINCFAFWGGIEIVVPPDVHVDSTGFAFMGGFEQSAELESRPPEGAPTIRINGFALMGGVDVKVAARGAALERPDW